MRSRIVALLGALLLGGAGTLWAQCGTRPAPPEEPATAKAGHMMGGSQGGSMMGAQSGTMTDDCKAMMTERQARMDEMKAMDARLDSLVSAMNAAQGGEKVDATAAVVSELVAQRKAIRELMESMQPMMMRHMQLGATTGMADAMSNCPMMAGTGPQESGHEMHP